MGTHTLTIVLVSYNSSFWLKKTMASLQKFYLEKTDSKVTVLLVDNGSSDDSVAMTGRLFPFVEIIECKENRGFAAANNLALAKAGTDYVMLLNPDTELNEQSNIDALMEYAARHRDTGMIGPKLLLTDGTLDPASHRGEPTLWPSLCYFLKLERLFPKTRWFNGYHRFDRDLTAIHEVEAISGAAMMVSREAMEQVGLLDETFFLYAEDLDWAKRFRDHGYKVVFDPEVVIIHHKYKSGMASGNARTRNESRTHFYRTMLQYYDKHYGGKYPQWLRRWVSAFIPVKKSAE
jgi:GT2 family glycosyltransferase